MSIEFLDYLNRTRDIRIKPKFSGEKTGFRCTPALRKPHLNRPQSSSYSAREIVIVKWILATLDGLDKQRLSIYSRTVVVVAAAAVVSSSSR